MKTLEIKNLNKSFRKRSVLKDFSLELEEGEIVSIIGDSGAGKSTLLRCINGLETIDSGILKINGNALSVSSNSNKIIKKASSNLEVGMVFQEYNLFPQYTVLENITLPLTKVLKLDKQLAIEKAKNLLKQMNLLKRIDAYPYELSGGEKQRLAISRTLAINPKIICFDEPTSALDPKLVKQVFKIIKDLSTQGKSILIVTHDISFADKISDRIIQLEAIN